MCEVTGRRKYCKGLEICTMHYKFTGTEKNITKVSCYLRSCSYTVNSNLT